MTDDNNDDDDDDDNVVCNLDKLANTINHIRDVAAAVVNNTYITATTVTPNNKQSMNTAIITRLVPVNKALYNFNNKQNKFVAPKKLEAVLVNLAGKGRLDPNNFYSCRNTITSADVNGIARFNYCMELSQSATTLVQRQQLVSATDTSSRNKYAVIVAKSISRCLFEFLGKKINKSPNTSYDSLGKHILKLKKLLVIQGKIVIIGSDYSQVKLQKLNVCVNHISK